MRCNGKETVLAHSNRNLESHSGKHSRLIRACCTHGFTTLSTVMLWIRIIIKWVYTAHDTFHCLCNNTFELLCLMCMFMLLTCLTTTFLGRLLSNHMPRKFQKKADSQISHLSDFSQVGAFLIKKRKYRLLSNTLISSSASSHWRHTIPSDTQAGILGKHTIIYSMHTFSAFL